MSTNVGNPDRLIRLSLAAILVSLSLTGVLEGILGYVALGAAAILLLTALIGFCPLYTLLGLSTCRARG